MPKSKIQRGKNLFSAKSFPHLFVHLPALPLHKRQGCLCHLPSENLAVFPFCYKNKMNNTTMTAF